MAYAGIRLTQLSLSGLPSSVYGSFAGKARRGLSVWEAEADPSSAWAEEAVAAGAWSAEGDQSAVWTEEVEL